MFLAAFVAPFVLAAAPPIQGQTVNSRDPASIEAALRGKGLPVERVATEKDPTYRSQSGGVRFTILFWGCGQSSGCDSTEFTAVFGGATNIDPAVVTAWNQRHPDARIFRRANGNAVLSLSVFFRPGAISKAEYDSKIDYWIRLLPEFRAATAPRPTK